MKKSAMQSQVEGARSSWLDKANPDMTQVEELYKEALDSILDHHCSNNNKSKKRKLEEQELAAQLELECWERLTVEQYCMILCQSGRANQAKPWLQRLGCTCRLAQAVLDYPTDTHTDTHDHDHNSDTTTCSIACHAWDNLLSPCQLQHMQDVFNDPQADYWLQHNYQVEPPSPYFSYIIPLQRQHNSNSNNSNMTVDTKFGALGTIIQTLHSHFLPQFPKLATASMVELWAHNRPHPTGHQFHFDSDNEGQGRIIKNPIMTIILYLSTTCGGGPSVVTNQSLVSKNLATRAVLSHPSTPGRVVAFAGNLLHGVIPGKYSPSTDPTTTHNNNTNSSSSHRRVTVMLAYWRRIRVRPSDKPGAARPFPNKGDSPWSDLLVRPQSANDNESPPPVEQHPIPIDHVYETLDGEPWTKAMGFPEYDQVFQGF
ncbi:expressed unknown protein [Seminavis robusta]|uniref:Uncharacterized protein n=1 Tax=Seminavis robusta TaxID=568900 RepID=A0A9N8HGK3_9STRA|nr:expressed unknown protein [Seminavis robusta]|eukprot:Sro641_g179970.1 n/a (428) ;mRNA; f:16559-17842